MDGLMYVAFPTITLLRVLQHLTVSSVHCNTFIQTIIISRVLIPCSSVSQPTLPAVLHHFTVSPGPSCPHPHLRIVFAVGCSGWEVRRGWLRRHSLSRLPRCYFPVVFVSKPVFRAVHGRTAPSFLFRFRTRFVVPWK